MVRYLKNKFHLAHLFLCAFLMGLKFNDLVINGAVKVVIFNRIWLKISFSRIILFFCGTMKLDNKHIHLNCFKRCKIKNVNRLLVLYYSTPSALLHNSFAYLPRATHGVMKIKPIGIKDIYVNLIKNLI